MQKIHLVLLVAFAIQGTTQVTARLVLRRRVEDNNSLKPDVGTKTDSANEIDVADNVHQQQEDPETVTYKSIDEIGQIITEDIPKKAIWWRNSQNVIPSGKFASNTGKFGHYLFNEANDDQHSAEVEDDSDEDSAYNPFLSKKFGPKMWLNHTGSKPIYFPGQNFPSEKYVTGRYPVRQQFFVGTQGGYYVVDGKLQGPYPNYSGVKNDFQFGQGMAASKWPGFLKYPGLKNISWPFDANSTINSTDYYYLQLIKRYKPLLAQLVAGYPAYLEYAEVPGPDYMKILYALSRISGGIANIDYLLQEFNFNVEITWQDILNYIQMKATSSSIDAKMEHLIQFLGQNLLLSLEPVFGYRQMYLEYPTSVIQSHYYMPDLRPSGYYPNGQLPNRPRLNHWYVGEEYPRYRPPFQPYPHPSGSNGNYETPSNLNLDGSNQHETRPEIVIPYPGHPGYTEPPGFPGYPRYPAHQSYPGHPSYAVHSGYPRYPSIEGYIPYPGHPREPEQSEVTRPGAVETLPEKEPSDSRPDNQMAPPEKPGVLEPEQPGIDTPNGVKPGFPGSQLGRPVYPGGLWKPGYPGFPGHPGYPGYPGYPEYPGFLGYPRYPAHQSYPGHPSYAVHSGYPRYPTIQGIIPYPGDPREPEQSEVTRPGDVVTSAEKEPSDSRPDNQMVPPEKPGVLEPEQPGIDTPNGVKPGFPGSQLGRPVYPGGLWKPGYPGFPGHPDFPGYPGYPEYPGYPRHPSVPGSILFPGHTTADTFANAGTPPGKEPSDTLPDNHMVSEEPDLIEPEKPEVEAPNGVKPGFPGPTSGRPVYVGGSWKPGYPSYPEHPGFQGYPGHQSYPGHPGYPVHPRDPAHPGYPVRPSHQRYPSVPGKITYPGYLGVLEHPGVDAPNGVKPRFPGPASGRPVYPGESLKPGYPVHSAYPGHPGVSGNVPYPGHIGGLKYPGLSSEIPTYPEGSWDPEYSDFTGRPLEMEQQGVDTPSDVGTSPGRKPYPGLPQGSGLQQKPGSQENQSFPQRPGLSQRPGLMQRPGSPMKPYLPQRPGLPQRPQKPGLPIQPPQKPPLPIRPEPGTQTHNGNDTPLTYVPDSPNSTWDINNPAEGDIESDSGSGNAGNPRKPGQSIRPGLPQRPGSQQKPDSPQRPKLPLRPGLPQTPASWSSNPSRPIKPESPSKPITLTRPDSKPSKDDTSSFGTPALTDEEFEVSPGDDSQINIFYEMDNRHNFTLPDINDINEVLTNLLNELPNIEHILGLTAAQIEKVLPQHAAVAINTVCSSKVSLVVPQLIPAKNDIQVSLMNNHRNTTVPLNQIATLTEDPVFQPRKNVTLYITGWDIDAPANAKNMAVVYGCRNSTNLMVVNVGQYVRNIKEWLTLDTQAIGNMIADVLVEQLPSFTGADYHLIGHGLGAHVAGHIGNRYKELTKSMIARITGLDPTRHCGNYGNRLPARLSGNAYFTDSIHTNPHILGNDHPISDVDFYPNGMEATLQPHTSGVMGAHRAAVDYYLETVLPGMENSHLATPAVVPAASEMDIGNFKIPMGLCTPNDRKGHYVLATNRYRPYGKNSDPNWKMQCNNQ